MESRRPVHILDEWSVDSFAARARLSTRTPEPVNLLAEFRIRRKQVLGGLTHEYYVSAWSAEQVPVPVRAGAEDAVVAPLVDREVHVPVQAAVVQPAFRAVERRDVP